MTRFVDELRSLQWDLLDTIRYSRDQELCSQHDLKFILKWMRYALFAVCNGTCSKSDFSFKFVYACLSSWYKLQRLIF